MHFQGKPHQTPSGLPDQEKLGHGEIHPLHTSTTSGAAADSLLRDLSGTNEEIGWQANVNWKKFHPFACKTALNERGQGEHRLPNKRISLKQGRAKTEVKLLKKAVAFYPSTVPSGPGNLVYTA